MQISDETKNKIIELYFYTHKSIPKIIQEVVPNEKMSFEEFYDILNEYKEKNPGKIMIRKGNPGKVKKREKDEKDNKILELLENGLKQNEIAERVKLSKSAVSGRIKRMRKLGVEIAKKKETENIEINNKILEMIGNGCNRIQIENELGLSRETISQRIKKMRNSGVEIIEKKEMENIKILEMLANGLSYAEIGEKIGLSIASISYRIQQMKGKGIEIPKKNNIVNTEILKMVESGLNQTEIGEKVGLSQKTVSKRIKEMRENGVEIPKKKKTEKIKGTEANIAKGIVNLMNTKGASVEQVRTMAEICEVSTKVEELLKSIDGQER